MNGARVYYLINYLVCVSTSHSLIQYFNKNNDVDNILLVIIYFIHLMKLNTQTICAFIFYWMSVINLKDQGKARNASNSVRMDHFMVHSHRISQLLRQFDVIHWNMSHFKDTLRDIKLCITLEHCETCSHNTWGSRQFWDFI